MEGNGLFLIFTDGRISYHNRRPGIKKNGHNLKVFIYCANIKEKTKWKLMASTLNSVPSFYSTEPKREQSLS